MVIGALDHSGDNTAYTLPIINGVDNIVSTVEDTDKVDAIGVDRATGMVILCIFDHLDWSDEHRHLYLLQEKLNSYLRFLESHAIYEVYPAANGRELAVEIDFANAPSANALEFIEAATSILSNAGFKLTFTVDNCFV